MAASFEPREIREETSYDRSLLHQRTLYRLGQLNDKQRSIFDEVLEAVGNGDGFHAFIEGAGGCGKTFLYNAILCAVRATGRIALSVASSGIAAILLEGGRTAHSRFKIPIALHETSTCTIPAQSGLAALLRRAALIIWDEAPMAHRHAIEAFDRTMRDLLQEPTKPFGGVIFIGGGDYMQVPPVVRHGERAKIVAASLKYSNLWKHFRRFRLTENERLRRLPQHDAIIQAQWSTFLLRVGTARETRFSREDGVDDFIRLPDSLFDESTKSIGDLLDWVFPKLAEPGGVVGDADCAVLTPKNQVVDEINELAMRKFPGREHVFLSADSVKETSVEEQYPIEFLNTLSPAGTPPHRLVLKLEAPVMLLRNFDPSRGLCNGTRLIVKRLMDRVIEVEIASGSNKGDRVLLPRITIIPSDTGLPFDLRRRQYPVRPCFGMTINKAQGQTLRRVGLYLPEPCFSHGQLYVALSRVCAPHCLRALIFNDDLPGHTGHYTRNVVYPEIARDQELEVAEDWAPED